RAFCRMARWGESGFTFNTFAFCHHEVCARTLAQASAPMKLGIRPSAPGNRATLFFCSLVQTSFRNLSLLFILPRFSYILSCGSCSRRCKIRGMQEFIVVYVTAGSPAEGDRLARAVVEERHAACDTRIGPGRSVDRGRGQADQSDEELPSIKT